MLTTAFWTGLADRAIKTFFQVLAVLLVGSYMTSKGMFNVFSVDWLHVLGYSLGAMVLSVLTSFGSAPIGTPGTTSFLPGGA